MFESIVIQDAKSEGRAEGLVEGAQKKAIETAIKMLKKNMEPQTIAEFVDLPVEKVQELKAQLAADKK